MPVMQYKAEKPFNQKHLLTLQDWTPDEIMQCLALASDLKDKQKKGIPHEILKGKHLAMIFTKSSTRTRVSFEVGISQLGGKGLFLSDRDIQIGRGESIHDTAEVLSRFVDGIMIRTYKHSDVEGLAKYGSIPVINGLTDEFHPCQILADLLTVYEHLGKLKGLKLAFIGDGFNMAHSLMIGCSKLGIDCAVACPEDYQPKAEYVKWAEKNAEAAGSKVTVTRSVEEAMTGADVVYTDVWASMGQEEESRKRALAFKDYQVNAENWKFVNDGAVFLHCLPAHRGEEVTADIIDGKMSVVFDEAENRLHAQKAVMALLMK